MTMYVKYEKFDSMHVKYEKFDLVKWAKFYDNFVKMKTKHAFY